MKVVKLSAQTQLALDNLEANLKKLGKVAIAYSGGMDSSFLAIVAKNVLDKNSICLFVKSEFISDRESKIALKTVEEQKLYLHIVTASVLNFEKITCNHSQRCYHCKKAIFELLLSQKPDGFILCEGSVTDDSSDYRPGKKALEELEILSPLVEAGFSKEMITEVLDYWEIKAVARPAQSCLATRIATNTEISSKSLQQVEKGESILRDAGIENLRLRHHGEIARIEVDSMDMSSALSIIEANSKKLKALGFKYITLDVDGYKRGSMN